jgi:hypothetical protein
MYNQDREMDNKLLNYISLRGKGKVINLMVRRVTICLCSLFFGLPSTLSSNVPLTNGAKIEIYHQSEHSVEEEEDKPADALPRPYIEAELPDGDVEEITPEGRVIFDKKMPKNKIPRGSRPNQSIPRNPLPRNAIPSNPLPRNTTPKQSLERTRIEKNPLPRTKIPSNPIPRNKIPSNKIPRN